MQGKLFGIMNKGNDRKHLATIMNHYQIQNFWGFDIVIAIVIEYGIKSSE